MSGSMLIDLELLKLFIVFHKERWDISRKEVHGNFAELKKLLSEENYRTFFDDRHLINITINSDKISFVPEDFKMTKKIMTEISNTKKLERVVQVTKEHSDSFIEQLLLAITLYSAIEVCREPKKNRLECDESNGIKSSF